MHDKKYKAKKVFIPGGQPTITYNSRTERNLENRLADVKENHHKLVMITGPTKSGKTVLTLKMFPKDKAVWLEGGSFGSSEQDFWREIVQQLDTYTDETLSNSENKKTQRGIEGGLSLFGLGGKASASQAIGEGKSKTQSRKGNPKTIALKYLAQSKTPLVIDDFHYIPREEQAKLVRAVKSLIFDGLPVIFIAIPHRRLDVVKVQCEMTGRVDNIIVPHWEIEELIEIPKLGFSRLNVKAIDEIVERLAKESIGSPHLMQEFCRALCNTHNVEETLDHQVVIDSIDDQIFKRVAQNTGKVIFDKLSKGPKQRKDRIERKLKDGSSMDIYGLTLHALAKLRPGLQTIKYEDIKVAIREEVILKSEPQGSEIARVLNKMSEIAASDESSTPVIEWDKDERVLHVTDPFFAFYLRWRQPNDTLD